MSLLNKLIDEFNILTLDIQEVQEKVDKLRAKRLGVLRQIHHLREISDRDLAKRINLTQSRISQLLSKNDTA